MSSRQARRHPSRYALQPTGLLNPYEVWRAFNRRSKSDVSAYRKAIWPRPKAAGATLRPYAGPPVIAAAEKPKRVRKPRAKKAA